MKRKQGLNRKSSIKRKPRKNDRPEVRRIYAETHLSCSLCGARASSFGSWLEAHHILGGRFGRVDDERNLVMLCCRFGCQGHALAEGERCRSEGGLILPRLTLANVLWLKQEMGELDFTYLQTVAGKRKLPDPEPLPEALKALRCT